MAFIAALLIIWMLVALFTSNHESRQEDSQKSDTKIL